MSLVVFAGTRLIGIEDFPIYFFSFVRPTYSAQADVIFAAERDARRTVVQEEIELDTRMATVRHTPFAEGCLSDLFDGDLATVAATAGVDPAVIAIEFQDPVWLTNLQLTARIRDLATTIQVLTDEGTAPGRYEEVFNGLFPGRTLDLVLAPEPGPIRRLTIEIRDLNGVASSSVSLGDISLPGG